MLLDETGGSGTVLFTAIGAILSGKAYAILRIRQREKQAIKQKGGLSFMRESPVF